MTNYSTVLIPNDAQVLPKQTNWEKIFFLNTQDIENNVFWDFHSFPYISQLKVCILQWWIQSGLLIEGQTDPQMEYISWGSSLELCSIICQYWLQFFAVWQNETDCVAWYYGLVMQVFRNRTKSANMPWFFPRSSLQF